jgi:hypothetical protein
MIVISVRSNRLPLICGPWSKSGKAIRDGHEANTKVFCDISAKVSSAIEFFAFESFAAHDAARITFRREVVNKKYIEQGYRAGV